MERLVRSNDNSLLTVLNYLRSLEDERIEKVHLDCPELGEALAILKDEANTLRNGLRMLGVFKTAQVMLEQKPNPPEWDEDRVTHFIATSQGKCVTPTGRTDGHMKYVSHNDKNEMVCAFCRKKPDVRD
jgi:hypothetical protein